jgi:hypothetical protein
MWLAVAAGALGSGLAGVALARGWLGRDIAIPWLIAAGLVGLGRLAAHPLLGLHLGWLAAALLAALPLARRAVVALRADGALGDGLRALAFASAGMRGRWRIGTVGAWLGLHLLGLSVTLANLGLPILLGPAVVLGVIGPPALAGRRKRARRADPAGVRLRGDPAQRAGHPAAGDLERRPLAAARADRRHGIRAGDRRLAGGQGGCRPSRALALRHLERRVAGRGGAGLVGLGRRDAADARRHRQRSLRLRPDGVDLVTRGTVLH